MTTMVDDVTRNAALEAIYDEVTALAESDARAGVAPRALEGQLAEFQDDYDDAFTAALLQPGSPLN